MHVCFVQEAQWMEKEMDEKNQALQEKVNNIQVFALISL